MSREVLLAPLDDAHIAADRAHNFVCVPFEFETSRLGRSWSRTGDGRCLVRIFILLSAILIISNVSFLITLFVRLLLQNKKIKIKM